MKLKKSILTISAGALLAFSLTACGGGKKASETTTAATTTAAATEAAQTAANTGDTAPETDAPDISADNHYISFNGVDLKVGMTWDDAKDSLGSEVKPMEKIEPCGGGDYIQEMYFYDGLTVTTLRSETIVGIEVPMDTESSAAAGGQIKKGDSLEQIKEAFGEPSMEDEYMLVYEGANDSLYFPIDNNTVTSIAIRKNPD